ncbi:hypothetical protein [Enterococcus nangangensis]|uniref:hypothetical protein n=1 Tax=Enterococcus nangangensis TaxID=2559926 RepID=UPI0010F8D55D|nr:hypothetical protein [Enterococcus nangangensis]
MKKFFISSAFCVSLLFSMSFAISKVSANEVQDESFKSSNEILVSWHGTANLVSDAYNNITSSNNIFTDSPVIISDASNKATVYIMVVNESGEQLGSIKTLSPGSSVTLGPIPWDSGTYTIKGKAPSSSNEGVYTFTVD